MASAPSEMLELIARFDAQRDLYESPTYNEAQLRIDFVNPMFKALGWDVENTKGYAEAFREVVHEDAVKIAGTVKSPDYSFRVGGRRIFFLEAKKPAVNIRDDVGPAYQLRRYAWTAGLPLSILTNFRELAVYDCRIPPKYLEKASTARLWYFTYQDYPEKWDEIASVFSPDAIQHGAFDRYVQSHKKAGTQAFDDAFLDEMEEWRKKLAGNLAMRNAALDQSGLNFATQRIIDRIIFLRICEDRGIEPPFQLQGLLPGEQVYARLRELFTKGDHRYNSGLFHFREEKGRHEAPDELTPGLDVDDATLKHIIKRLYYPDSPYVFKEVAADILGSVYERFLGNVIRLTAGHRAKIEPKPEVRKAGGVYYTPTYIVDYIVKNTVGKLLEDKSPTEAAKLRILDPACGSGSFLLGAYQYLLDWHQQWYLAHDPDKRTKGKNATLRPGPLRQLVLSIRERKRILLDNIHGVDLDPQAVEVTKLSLLLKCLEGESAQSIDDLRLFHERALPDLGDNIKCGNSLISTDIYDTDAWKNLSEAERSRLRPFNWQDEFPAILKAGGFDAVIGNPPYGATINDHEVPYLRHHYQAYSSGLDSYVLFVERAIGLARPGAFVSFIVPTGWYTGADFSRIRQHIACTCDPLSFVNLPYDVFKAWVDTTVFVFKKRRAKAAWPRTRGCEVSLKTFPKRHRIDTAREMEDCSDRVDFASWFTSGDDAYLTFADARATSIIQRMEAVGRPLASFADVQRGVTPLDTTERRTHATSRAAFMGTVRRYTFERGPNVYVRFDATIAEPKPEKYFQGPRLLLRELISRQFRLQAVAVVEDFVTNKSMQSVLAVRGGPDLKYLLGVINSRLMSWYFLRKSSVAQRDDFPKIVLKESRALPIPQLDRKERTGKRQHDRMVALVEQMLSLHKSLAAAKSPHDKEALQRRIDATDRQIDRLVYELYGLTEEQIKIVEEATQ